MNTHQLTTFITVVKTGSFTRAAESLFLTQPAVTQQIKLLEEELQVKLFDRIGKKIMISSEGTRLLPLAENILLKMEEALYALKDHSGPLKGTIAIGASFTAGSYLLPPYLKKFTDRFPDVFISMEMGNTKQICEKVLEGALDIGIVGNITNTPSLIYHELARDELVMICPPSHPIARKKKLHMKELAGLPVIIRESGSGTWSQANHILKAGKIRLHPILQVGSVEAVKRTVAEGAGVSIISRVAVEKEIKDGDLRGIALSPLMERTFYLIFHKGKYINRLIKTFCDILGLDSIWG